MMLPNCSGGRWIRFLCRLFVERALCGGLPIVLKDFNWPDSAGWRCLTLSGPSRTAAIGRGDKRRYPTKSFRSQGVRHSICC